MFVRFLSWSAEHLRGLPVSVRTSRRSSGGTVSLTRGAVWRADPNCLNEEGGGCSVNKRSCVCSLSPPTLQNRPFLIFLSFPSRIPYLSFSLLPFAHSLLLYLSCSLSSPLCILSHSISLLLSPPLCACSLTLSLPAKGGHTEPGSTCSPPVNCSPSLMKLF